MPGPSRHSLRALFVALNDEAVVVRALAVGVVGRLAAFNPAYVLPALRRHLMQLLNDMDHSPDSRQREGAPRPMVAVSPEGRFTPLVLLPTAENKYLLVSRAAAQRHLLLARIAFLLARSQKEGAEQDLSHCTVGALCCDNALFRSSSSSDAYALAGPLCLPCAHGSGTGTESACKRVQSP